MYCKNCGAYNEDDAKFCSSCGSKLDQPHSNNQEEYHDYFDEPVHQEDYHDEHSSNIYGKKFEPTALGNVSFGRRRNPMSRLLAFSLIVGVLAFGYFVFFTNKGPIYDVVISEVEPDGGSMYPDQPIGELNPGEWYLYVSYSATEIKDETVKVTVTNTDLSDFPLYTESLNIIYEEQEGYFGVYHNWTIGTYEIRFEYDGEIVNTYRFNVVPE